MEDEVKKNETHQFDTLVAQEVGVIAAVIYYNIHHWCKHNRVNKKHFHDGYFWTYNSCSAFTDLYPYLSKNQISYALEKLESAGYILVGNYNAVSYDRTKWYADIKGIEKIQKSISEISEMEIENFGNGNEKIQKPIPDINTNINSDINSDNISPDISDDISSPRSDSSEYPSWVKSCIEEEKPTTDKPKKTKSKKCDKETHFDDIIKNADIPEDVKPTFYEFIEARNIKGKPMNDLALTKLINKSKRLSNNDGVKMKELLDEAIINGWQSVFDHSDREYPKPTKQKEPRRTNYNPFTALREKEEAMQGEKVVPNYNPFTALREREERGENT